MEAIAELAGVTSGAFYHHFRDKRACFEAVYVAVEQDLFDRITEAWRAKSDRWERSIAGTEAFFDACVATDVRQIILIDGPSVLGWDAWHEIEGRYHFSTMRDGLKALMKAGYLEPWPPEPLAHLLFGALNEAARLIAHASDPEPLRRELMDAHIRLMEGLRPAGAGITTQPKGLEAQSLDR
jgi:AcrR family transcriptional regulator